jgi:hypothetical protein
MRRTSQIWHPDYPMAPPFSFGGVTKLIDARSNFSVLAPGPPISGIFLTFPRSRGVAGGYAAGVPPGRISFLSPPNSFYINGVVGVPNQKTRRHIKELPWHSHYANGGAVGCRGCHDKRGSPALHRRRSAGRSSMPPRQPPSTTGGRSTEIFNLEQEPRR